PTRGRISVSRTESRVVTDRSPEGDRVVPFPQEPGEVRLKVSCARPQAVPLLQAGTVRHLESREELDEPRRERPRLRALPDEGAVQEGALRGRQLLVVELVAFDVAGGPLRPAAGVAAELGE